MVNGLHATTSSSLREADVDQLDSAIDCDRRVRGAHVQAGLARESPFERNGTWTPITELQWAGDHVVLAGYKAHVANVGVVQGKVQLS